MRGHVGHPALSQFAVVLCTKPNLLGLGSSIIFQSQESDLWQFQSHSMMTLDSSGQETCSEVRGFGDYWIGKTHTNFGGTPLLSRNAQKVESRTLWSLISKLRWVDSLISNEERWETSLSMWYDMESGHKVGEMFYVHSIFQVPPQCCCLTTRLHSEILFLWGAQGPFNSLSESQISGQSVFTEGLILLKWIMHIRLKALCDNF